MRSDHRKKKYILESELLGYLVPYLHGHSRFLKISLLHVHTLESLEHPAAIFKHRKYKTVPPPEHLQCLPTGIRTKSEFFIACRIYVKLPSFTSLTSSIADWSHIGFCAPQARQRSPASGHLYLPCCVSELLFPRFNCLLIYSALSLNLTYSKRVFEVVHPSDYLFHCFVLYSSKLWSFSEIIRITF